MSLFLKKNSLKRKDDLVKSSDITFVNWENNMRTIIRSNIWRCTIGTSLRQIQAKTNLNKILRN
jgi:hypothetical protein